MNDRQKQLEAFNRILDVLDELRVKCPWDRKQTNDSLRPNTIEETYELCDALITGDPQEISKELGDVLLHVLFYAKIGSEKEQFDIADVCNRLCDKLIFRHPHVFGEQAAETAEEVVNLWEQVKQKEKGGNKTVLAGVPASLPSLIKAYRIQDKARAVGFDWEEKEQVWDKVKEEISEFEAELKNGTDKDIEAEFGDVLFSLINAARLYHINPDNALELTNQKFIRRFNYLEQHTLKQGRDLKDMTLAEMDELWNEAKKLENGLRVEKNFSLRTHNTFGIDEHCDQFIEYHTVQQLHDALPLLGEKWMHIGSGANLLFTQTFHGTILKNAIPANPTLTGDGQVHVGASMKWDDFVQWTIDNGLSGLECLSLIPAEIGGATVQNIGAYGSEIGEHVTNVHVLDTTDGQEKDLSRDDCGFSYRNSVFKSGRYIILSVNFQLSATFVSPQNRFFKDRVFASAQEVRDTVIEIRRSKLPEVNDVGSAGSFFKNPVVNEGKSEALKAKYPDMPQYLQEDGVKLSAGWLIDQAGWKGRGVKENSRAATYEKQALVIVNRGGATGKDVMKLATAIKESVMEKFGVALTEEVVIL